MYKIIAESAFLMLVLFAFVLQKPETLLLGSFFCTAYFGVNARRLRVNRGELILVLLTVLICVTSVLGFNHGLSPLFYLISSIFAFYAAKCFSRLSIDDLNSSLELVFWFCILVIGCALVIYWESPEPFGEVIPGSSTNGIPSYLIVLQIALSLSSFLKNKRLPIYSSAFTVAVALFGLGRGSIVVSLAILGFSVFYNLVARKSKFPLIAYLVIFFFIDNGGIVFWDKL